jgi:hypothetical protein
MKWRVKQMKLSERMKEVLILMRDNWELGRSLTMSGRSWLQKNGLGRGGSTKDVRADTFYALYKRGLIQSVKRAFPMERWALTPKGIATASEL